MAYVCVELLISEEEEINEVKKELGPWRYSPEAKKDGKKKRKEKKQKENRKQKGKIKKNKEEKEKREFYFFLFFHYSVILCF